MPDEPKDAPSGSNPSGDTPDVPTIDLTQELPPPAAVILSEAGEATEGTFTQRAGMKLAKWVGALGAAVTLLIVCRWIWMSWCTSCPNIPASATAEQAKAFIENYKALQDQAVQSGRDMFDAVVVKALLPIFTSILGYIFGARSQSEGKAEDKAS